MSKITTVSHKKTKFLLYFQHISIVRFDFLTKKLYNKNVVYGKVKI